MTREQLTIEGTDPARDPEIDEVLFPWLNAKQEKSAAGKREKNHHASLQIRLLGKKIAKYPYTDPDTGKRRFVYAENKVVVKTSKAPAERRGRGRRGRKAAEDVGAERDVKPAPGVSDPFEATRAKMREGAADRDRRSVLDEAREAQAATTTSEPDEDADDETTAAIPFTLSLFALGDRVTWKSQASGVEKRKTGEVLAVVPPGKRPGEVFERANVKRFDTTRDHVSYIVEVDGELYWPVASKLKPAKSGKGKR